MSFNYKSVLLGGFDLHDLERAAKGEEIYCESPVIYDKERHILAKHKLHRFFQEEIGKTQTHFLKHDKKAVYSVDLQHRVLKNEASAVFR